jgi:metallo-beta-lactamase family protein
MKLSFLGAAGTVTGSKYLLEHEGTKLLVDCGLYQGVKSLRLRNRRALPVAPPEIDAVVLSHAHIDHSGHLPALARDGFSGPVYCSPPTRELCQILLPDAARLQEEEARYSNKKGTSKHHPALPLYTSEDAEAALKLLEAAEFGERTRVGPFELRLIPAGHILGAASVEVACEGRTLLFSGDLGSSNDLLMRPPEAPGAPDWVVIESTYGDRLHEDADPIERVAEILKRVIGRGGTLLIPSFAVGRTQTLLYCFYEIFRRELCREVPVFVNSPMATNVTQLFRRSAAYHRLSPEQVEKVCDIAHYVRTPEESRKLSEGRYPAVIISASGMASGPRPPQRHPGTGLPGARDARRGHGRRRPQREDPRLVRSCSRGGNAAGPLLGARRPGRTAAVDRALRADTEARVRDARRSRAGRRAAPDDRGPTALRRLGPRIPGQRRAALTGRWPVWAESTGCSSTPGIGNLIQTRVLSSDSG